MAEIVVGRADWRNFDHFWKLRLDYTREEVERDPTLALTSPDQAARLAYQTQECLFDNGTVVLMAYQGEDAIGYMIFEVGDFVGFHERAGIKVNGFYVRPEFRHGPAGQKMLRAGYDLVRKNGYPRTQAVVMAGNDPMRSQLERNGYRLVAVVYERGESNGKHDERAEAEQEVHPAGSGGTSAGSSRDDVGSAVPSGSTTRVGIRKESIHV